MSTHIFVLHEFTAAATLSVNKTINVNHSVKRVEVSCIVNCQNGVTANREDDVNYASLKVKSNLPFYQADGLCPFFTNGVWSPKITFYPSPETVFGGEYNFQVIDLDGNLQSIPNEGAFNILISFYAE